MIKIMPVATYNGVSTTYILLKRGTCYYPGMSCNHRTLRVMYGTGEYETSHTSGIMLYEPGVFLCIKKGACHPFMVARNNTWLEARDHLSPPTTTRHATLRYLGTQDGITTLHTVLRTVQHGNPVPENRSCHILDGSGMLRIFTGDSLCETAYKTGMHVLLPRGWKVDTFPNRASLLEIRQYEPHIFDWVERDLSTLRYH